MSNALNLDGTPYRTPPHNLDAERGIIGAILIDNRAMENVSDYLRPEHFMAGQHGLIYSACAKLIERGQIADPITLKRFFESEESLAEIGGPAYLAKLAVGAPTIVNAAAYGKIVYDLAIKRDAITEARAVIEMAYDDVEPGAIVEAIGKAADKMCDIDTGRKPRMLSEVMRSTVEQAKNARETGFRGVKTGLADLDRKLGGYRKSQLIIVAGRPGMGKSVFAAEAARAVATAGETVAFFSLEMSGEDVSARLIQRRTSIDSAKLAAGDLEDCDISSLEGSIAHYDIPLIIDDTADIGVQAIKAKAKRIRRKHGLGLVVVDYLQLIRAENRYQGNRVNEVSEITRALKVMAKDLDVPVLVLSQLSRNVEQRDNKRPHLSDLRDSGSIEQDADVVMMLYRPAYYLEQMVPEKKSGQSEVSHVDAMASYNDTLAAIRHRLEVNVAKQRGGATGLVTLHCDLEKMTISSADWNR